MSDPIEQKFVYEFQASTVTDPVLEEFLNTVVDGSMKLPAASLEEQNTLGLDIRRAWLKLYKGTGHGLHWDKPQKFTDDLEGFLRMIET